MDTVRVELGPRSYDIRFGAITALARPTPNALVVADANVLSFARTVQTAMNATGIIIVPPGEASKSPGELTKLYDALAALPADRGTLIVAVGGGVVGDLAGFAAATFNRGIPWLAVPTTLLAMVDSSIGGKTGINHAKGKNLIGAFHQPSGVWIDLEALKTLPEREYRSGLAEVVKYGVAQDADFFEWLETNANSIIRRERAALEQAVAVCVALKARVVEADERELTGRRAVLNYGHTFAHAFETLGGYSQWLHGEAVSAGMTCAARLAVKLGRIEESILSRHSVILTRFGLPTAIPPQWKVEDLIDVMRRDKKATAGRLRFVLPSRLGHAELVDGVDESLVREVLTSS